MEQTSLGKTCFHVLKTGGPHEARFISQIEACVLSQLLGKACSP